MITVAELIAQLQTMPQDIAVQVNDNRGGEVYDLDSVDLFDEGSIALEPEDEPVVILQVNC
jgi:hypothetical protein